MKSNNATAPVVSMDELHPTAGQQLPAKMHCGACAMEAARRWKLSGHGWENSMPAAVCHQHVLLLTDCWQQAPTVDSAAHCGNLCLSEAKAVLYGGRVNAEAVRQSS